MLPYYCFVPHRQFDLSKRDPDEVVTRGRVRDIDSRSVLVLILRRGKWQYLIKHTTYDQLAAATSETHGDPTIEGQRSACWKIFLLFDNFDQGQWLAKLRTSRDAFESLKHHFLQSMENEDEVEDPLNDDVEVSFTSVTELQCT